LISWLVATWLALIVVRNRTSRAPVGGTALPPGSAAFALPQFQLLTSLLPVSDCVVGAERDLVPAREQKLLAAL
jgi:hypothetical protein